MSQIKYKNYITSLVDNIPKKFENKAQQQAYEKGFLIGILVNLALDDSRNFYIIKKKFGALNED